MYGIQIKHPLKLLIVMAVLDLILVGLFRMNLEPLTYWVSPVVLGMWAMAIAFPDWRYDPKKEQAYQQALQQKDSHHERV